MLSLSLLMGLLAATTVLGQGQLQPSITHTLYSGAELAKALADPSGPVTLQLGRNFTTVTDADFASYSLPITVWRNVTIQGWPDRWLALSTNHMQGKVRLANTVTMTLQYVIMSDFFDENDIGAAVDILCPMNPGERGIIRLVHAALIRRWCFPPALARAYLGEDQRPSWVQGVNLYNATAPSFRNGSTGLTGGGGSGGADGCINDTRALPLERCWSHMAYCIDYAIAGRTYDPLQKLYPTGYLIHAVDTYMLCEYLLEDECLTRYSPIGCMRYTKHRDMAAGGGNGSTVAETTGDSRPSGGDANGDLLHAGAGDTVGKGWSAGLRAAVGCVIGGTLLIGVLLAAGVVVVRCRRTRQRSLQSAPPCKLVECTPTTASGGHGCSSGASPPQDSGFTKELMDRSGKGVSSSGCASLAAAKVKAAGEGETAANSDDCDLESDGAGYPAPHRLETSTEPSRATRPREQHVVVTPLTPLRADLELYPDLARAVTLLPVVRGKGSYGKVCEGLYGGERVAVKIVRDLLGGASGAAMDRILSSFAQEVQVMGRCQHRNVVRLLAACLRPPRFCLVMELMDTSLQRLVFGTPGQLLPLPKVLHIATEIARALEYLHPTIVHRDLKPDNVLISAVDSPTPTVKVSDFGLSRLRSTVVSTVHPEAGTPSYMAPECFDLYTSRITHHVDMYAWGVVVWAMLTGMEPWMGCGVVEIAYRSTLLDERLPLLDSVASGRCPARLQQLVERCWNRTPERRPAAAEVAKEMLLIAQQLHSPQALEGGTAGLSQSPGSVLSRIHEYAAAAAAANASAGVAAAAADVAAGSSPDGDVHSGNHAAAPGAAVFEDLDKIVVFSCDGTAWYSAESTTRVFPSLTMGSPMVSVAVSVAAAALSGAAPTGVPAAAALPATCELSAGEDTPEGAAAAATAAGAKVSRT